jgi:hypothetical protein
MALLLCRTPWQYARVLPAACFAKPRHSDPNANA